MSLYYASNQRRQRKFNTEDRLREVNQDHQQDIVDDKLSLEFGLENDSSSKIGNLTRRVLNKLEYEDEEKDEKPLLTENINNKTLSDIFDILKKTYKILNDKNVKNKINETLLKSIKTNQSAEVVASVIEKMLNEIGIPSKAIVKAKTNVKQSAGISSKE